MRCAAGLSAMRRRITARDPDRAELLLYALGQAQGPRYQRAQRQRAQDRRPIQGVAWTRLRLLFNQALTACQENPQRRQELSDRTAMDDQPLMRGAGPIMVACRR